MIAARKPSLDALVGIRFIAAMHIVMHHYVIMVPGFRTGAPDWLRRLIAAAPTSVDLFFVLSGFVLAYNYAATRTGLAVSKREFWNARIARIYPVYLLGLIIYVPIAAARYASGTGSIVGDISPGATFFVSGGLALFLLQSWSVVFWGWNGPSWSISAEAFFYFIFPWALRPLMSATPRRLFWTSAILWAVSLIAPAYFVIAVVGHSSQQVLDLWEVVLLCHPLLRSIPFFIGIVTGLAFLRWGHLGVSRAWLAEAAAAAILLVMALVPTAAGRLMDNALTPFFAALVYLLALERGWLAHALVRRWLVRLGEASYALYILHNPLWNYLTRLPNIVSIARGHFPVGQAKPGTATEWNYDMSWWSFGAYLVILIVCALIVHQYVEQPARVWIRRRFLQRQRARQTPEAVVSV
jgi:peptidoglycan/LPS O-acetylase OafA/YrhL